MLNVCTHKNVPEISCGSGPKKRYVQHDHLVILQRWKPVARSTERYQIVKQSHDNLDFHWKGTISGNTSATRENEATLFVLNPIGFSRPELSERPRW